MPFTDSQRRQQTSYGPPQTNRGTRDAPQSRSAFEPRSNYRAPYHSGIGIGGHNNNYNKFKVPQQRYQRKEAEPPNFNRRPHLFIRYAGLSIRRAIVASADLGISWSTTLLKFQPSSQASFAHLSGQSLHVLALDQSTQRMEGKTSELCAKVENMAVGAAGDQKSSLSERLTAREVADSVVDNLHSDMSAALDNVRSYLESRFWVDVKPKLSLRFGRMLFHSRQNRSNLAEHKPFDAKGLERLLHGGNENEDSVMKTFDSGVSHDYFRKIRSLIGIDGRRTQVSKERFIIQVADSSQPQVALICICRRRLEGDKTRLTLLKVKSDPLRHMVADFACMDKTMDLRLILTTQQEFKGIKDGLQAIVERAVYDVKAEGGLYWPLGSTASGPFLVTGVSHVIQTNLTSKGYKWKLRHANRTALNASAGRFSYEIDVTADDWARQFQICKDVYDKDLERENCKYSDGLFKPLSTLLSWVWENCI